MEVLWVIHGPNLNRLGRREPEIYGTATLAEIDRRIAERAAQRGVEARILQTPHEGTIIEEIHKAADCGALGIILNAGAYTHTSYAIRDAVASVETPVVEVHLSNIFAREAFRSRSVLAPACAGSIVGFGPAGYLLAIDALIGIHEEKAAGGKKGEGGRV